MLFGAEQGSRFGEHLVGHSIERADLAQAFERDLGLVACLVQREAGLLFPTCGGRRHSPPAVVRGCPVRQASRDP